MWCYILLIDNLWNIEYKEKLELISIFIFFVISFLCFFKGNSEWIKNDIFVKEDNVKKKKLSNERDVRYVGDYLNVVYFD